MEDRISSNEIQDYEQEHIEILKKLANECTLFLKKNNSFPIEKPCKVLLVGSGARNTIKGGTGSGDVNSRFYVSCEQGLEKAKFEIVSKNWLEQYPKYKEAKKKDFINYVKSESAKYKCVFSGVYAVGLIQEEVDYNLSLDYNAEIAIYVLARSSGEGQDRRIIKGDVLLTDTEIKDILYLNSKFEKFMLVLNVGGVIDISPVKEVSNILLLSQLGVVTGDILADIILGKSNPSGKLTTTWAKIDDYKFLKDFGDLNDTRYTEGVYVGYRYFNSAKVKSLFPFGFGQSYTEFEYNKVSLENDKNEININVNVKNIGKYPGKEVIQVYISPSQMNIDKPFQSLIAFKKTKLLSPQEEETLYIKFKLDEIATYNEIKSSFILDNGKYIIRVGNSSEHTNVYGIINLKDNILIKQLTNIGGKSDFEDFKIKVIYDDNLSDIQTIDLTKEDFETKIVEYKYEEKINEKLSKLSDQQLAYICLGDYDNSIFSMLNNIGCSSKYVVGAAGDTTSRIKEIEKYIVMSDGPAGIRITPIYGIEGDKKYPFFKDNFIDLIKDYVPGLLMYLVDPLKKNSWKKGKLYYQYTTAIPIGTALAQTFNEELLEKIGNIIGTEMEIFKIHLWLAPALNIHRNILCGRNFEYFSEDPIVSGKIASSITKGVQSHKNKGVTIKHFACNNQEFNRNNNNSIVSERALREIYLKGFEIAIKESKPCALMTSYNLLNGTHTSERKDLINNVLRIEWEYDGLIMSDWMSSGRTFLKLSKHPAQYASNNIKAGNDLTMPGDNSDYKDILNAIKTKKISRNDLLQCASRIYKAIEKLNE